MSNATESPITNFMVKQVANLSSIVGVWKVAVPPMEKIAYKLAVDKGDPIEIGPRRQREDK